MWKRYLQRLSRYLPDRIYLRVKFFQRRKQILYLNHPRTFNEKMQWLKIHDRQSHYPRMADKYEAKKYIAERCGDQHLIPALGIWNSVEEIPWDELPERFVLKTTHDSGTIVLCSNKSKLNRNKAEKKLRQGMTRNYFWHGREWPYRDLSPRILAEPYLSESDGRTIRDYKVWCFNGEPEMTAVCSDRFTKTGLCEDFYDREWRHMPVQQEGLPNSQTEIPKPKNYEDMFRHARILAKDTYFLRVDFYEVRGEMYVGELTFYPFNGFKGFIPEEWDKKLGERIDLDREGS